MTGITVVNLWVFGRRKEIIRVEIERHEKLLAIITLESTDQTGLSCADKAIVVGINFGEVGQDHILPINSSGNTNGVSTSTSAANEAFVLVDGFALTDWLWLVNAALTFWYFEGTLKSDTCNDVTIVVHLQSETVSSCAQDISEFVLVV
jgi:hypothetical protein